MSNHIIYFRNYFLFVHKLDLILIDDHFYFSEDIVIGESLVLEKVTREDMGKYMCIARNAVQPAASKIFDLSVNCKHNYKKDCLKIHSDF